MLDQMIERKSSRRHFLKASAGAAGALVLAACAPAATPAPSVPPEEEEIVLNIDFRGYGPNEEGTAGAALTQLLAEYKELHPNVVVNHTPIDPGAWDDIQQWSERRLVAKDGPDLLFGNWTYLVEKWMEADLVGFWDDYLVMPNPYVPGNQNWRDQFIMPSDRQSNGKKAWLGLDNTTLWSFYNKDMFAEMGIEPPKTWPEQTAMHETIRENGVIPVADYHSLAYAVWSFDPVADQILHDLFEEIAGGKRQEPLPAEIAEYVVNGKYGITSPEYQDSLRIATDWWQYAPEGAFSGGDDQGYQLFLSGKAAYQFLRTL